MNVRKRKGIEMEAITAREARIMVDKRLGKARGLPEPEVETQMKLFNEELERAISNNQYSFELQFKGEICKETIDLITDRKFSIWKVYRLENKSTFEVPLLLDQPNKGKDGCVSYKFYF